MYFSLSKHPRSKYPPIKNKTEFVAHIEKCCGGGLEAFPEEEFNVWFEDGLLWFRSHRDFYHTDHSKDEKETRVLRSDLYKVCIQPFGLVHSCYEDGVNWSLRDFGWVHGNYEKEFVGQNTCHIGDSMYWLIERKNFNCLTAFKFNYEAYRQKTRDVIERLYQYKKAGKKSVYPEEGVELDWWYPDIETLERMLRDLQ